MKKILSMLCVLALAVGLVPGATATGTAGLTAQGWFETICAELTGVADADVTDVTYTGSDGVAVSLEGEDFDFLVRDMTGGVRIDIPGVAAGTYSLSVAAKGQTYTAEGIEVKAYDRSGFAHKVHILDKNGNITGIQNYTEGVGAYNDDGTLKPNAIVLYVTDENKETVKMTVGDTSVTGIGKILNSGQATKNKVEKVLEKASVADKPVVVRIVGDVTQPQGVSEWSQWPDKNDSTKFDGNNGGMCFMAYAKNLTVEGIGTDATIDGWGISFTGDAAYADNRNYGKNFEVRNLSFRNVPEDCVEIAGNAADDGSIKEPVSHAWVHNCAFHVPHIENPAADDKAEGDGALDFKSGYYVTSSYNYFEGYHKTSLLGGGDSIQQYHVTWHHNWWKNVESRAPLCRQADMHIYNNLYESQSSYCMSLRANCYIFSEYNLFKNCKDPVKNEPQHSGGGVCKSFGDRFENCTGAIDVTKVPDRDVAVESENPYASFELSSDLSYIPEGDYLLEESVTDAQAVIAAYTGVMKPLADITHPEVHHHVWSEWTVDKANTCTEPGHRTRTCSAPGCPLDNGLDDQNTVPLGHRWGPWETVFPATCTTAGKRSHTCVREDAATETLSVPALGHKFDDTGVCTVCGGLDTSTSYLFDPARLQDGTGADPFFTCHYAASTFDPNSANKDFADGFKGTCRIKTSGAPSKTANSVSFTTSGPATVTVYWVAAGDTRQMVVVNDAGGQVAVTTEESKKNGIYTSVLTLKQAGSYHLGAKGGQNYLFGIRVACDQETQGAGTMGATEGGLTWTYAADGTLNLGGPLPETDRVLAACWDDQGRFAGVKLLDATHMGAELGTGWSKVRLFWLNTQRQPQCQAVDALNGGN